MMQLKNYQQEVIKSVSEYLSTALEKGAEKAFVEKKVVPGKPVPVYRTFGMGDIPYICLRIPTGGGKTLLASHLIRNVAHDYLMRSNVMVLWLVPSTAILEQTFNALRTARHPYREALEEYFGNSVEVFSFSEIENIKPDNLESETCIVVGTIQSLRVRSTESRIVYDHWEAFEQHFTDMASIPEGLEKNDDGSVKFSFANVCHLNKPLIIMDEAHNAKTPLSFETLQRLSPSCIIELTATPNTTPQNGSNVLESITALQLKQEGMIKLPIVLTEHQSWQAAISGTVITREKLHAEAKLEEQYIRPLALYQAQHKDQQVTYQTILDYLVQQENIPREKIAIATGDVRELNDIDLFSRECEIEHIITVEALKEGWDCSFAYVFCSVANKSSQKDVEQILGRVLRMPYVTKRKQDLLNYAYAHVSSAVFAEAAKTLQDTLVDKLGFERFEADLAVVQSEVGGGNKDQMDVFEQEEKPVLKVKDIDVTKLSQRVQDSLEIKQTTSGKEITVKTEIDAEIEKQLLFAVPEDQRESLKSDLIQIKAKSYDFGQIIKTRNEVIKVPKLAYLEDDFTSPLECDDFLDFGQWDLNRFPAELPDFALEKQDNVWKIDVDTLSKVKIQHDGMEDQIKILPYIDDLSRDELVIWLDKNIAHTDIPQAKTLKFISDVVNYLVSVKSIGLEDLIITKFVLVKAIERKINEYRDSARKEGYQSVITETNENLVVDFRYSYDFISDPASYPVSKEFTDGRFSYNKHFYPIISDMNTEEAECAMLIDKHPMVKHWIRNLERKPLSAFWLPTSTDRFYPDFVAELTDGRLLVVEYKGEQIRTTDDTKEKALVGKVWEKQSCGRCLFLMAVNLDETRNATRKQIEDKIVN